MSVLHPLWLSTPQTRPHLRAFAYAVSPKMLLLRITLPCKGVHDFPLREALGEALRDSLIHVHQSSPQCDPQRLGSGPLGYPQCPPEMNIDNFKSLNLYEPLSFHGKRVLFEDLIIATDNF